MLTFSSTIFNEDAVEVDEEVVFFFKNSETVCTIGIIFSFQSSSLSLNFVLCLEEGVPEVLELLFCTEEMTDCILETACDVAMAPTVT